MTANPWRGEAAIELPEGEPIALRPTFAALVAAEAELGALFSLVERMGAGELALAETIALFWHIRAAPDQWPDRAAFSEVLMGAGLVRLTPALKTVTGQILLGR